jgi:anti-sigma regulatory factor (Ser/Thr protein kinase)
VTSLLVTAAASAQARDELDRWLSATVGDEFAHRVGLAGSEVVSNVVRHAGLRPGSSVGLSVDVDHSSVRVSVEQASSAIGAAVVAPPDRGEDGGFGSAIVQDITDRWGVHDGPPGSVWFEIDRHPAGEPTVRHCSIKRPKASASRLLSKTFPWVLPAGCRQNAR